jgi:hypothetical protein
MAQAGPGWATGFIAGEERLLQTGIGLDHAAGIIRAPISE